ncbi:MAG: hypothetical protein K5882_05900 [Bacteroidales bacterium]|nr:hypothetical protein [Bacteroidales bacterium]
MWGEDYYVSEFTSASTGTALSISLMRVEAVWDRETRDGGYGRSRRRKERSWRRCQFEDYVIT